MRTIPVRVATASAIHIHGMKRSLRAIAVPDREVPQTRKSIMTTDDSTIPIDRMCSVCIVGTSQVIRRITMLIGKPPTHCESSAIMVASIDPKGCLVERFRDSNHMRRHSGAPRSGEPGIHNHGPRDMDSGLATFGGAPE